MIDQKVTDLNPKPLHTTRCVPTIENDGLGGEIFVISQQG